MLSHSRIFTARRLTGRLIFATGACGRQERTVLEFRNPEQKNVHKRNLSSTCLSTVHRSPPVIICISNRRNKSLHPTMSLPLNQRMLHVIFDNFSSECPGWCAKWFSPHCPYRLWLTLYRILYVSEFLSIKISKKWMHWDMMPLWFLLCREIAPL